MPLSPLDRKAELVRRGISMSEIARRLGVTSQHVSSVVAGKRRSPRIEEEVARSIEKPAARVFGESSAA